MENLDLSGELIRYKGSPDRRLEGLINYIINNGLNLKSLDLRSNQLTTIPENIGSLDTLQSLYLMENKLTTLPENIGRLNTLQNL